MSRTERFEHNFDWKKIGDRLTLLIEADGRSIAELERKSGMIRRRIQNLINGDDEDYRAIELKNLAIALDSTLEYLLFGITSIDDGGRAELAAMFGDFKIQDLWENLTLEDRRMAQAFMALQLTMSDNGFSGLSSMEGLMMQSDRLSAIAQELLDEDEDEG